MLNPQMGLDHDEIIGRWKVFTSMLNPERDPNESNLEERFKSDLRAKLAKGSYRRFLPQ